MRNWKTTLKTKKIQRHVNAMVRDLNRNIERDELWKGRFYAHQIYSYFTPAEDHTWVYGRFLIEFVDKKTGKTRIKWFLKEQLMGSCFALWFEMNMFIVDDVKVWSEEPRPSLDNTVDYRERK